MSKFYCTWLVILLVNIELCNSSGKIHIRFVRLQNNRKIKNGDCCDNLWTCTEACDVFLEICATEVSQSNCNADKFRSKVFGKGPNLTFPGAGGDLGNGRKNPLEYTFQRWQGFSLAIEIWDYDSSFLKGASDFVDNVHLDINDRPDQNSTSVSSKAKRMASSSSPSERYIDLQISIYCDDNYLPLDCARQCIARDDAQGHYTCNYIRGLVICNQHWHGDNCTQYCRPRNDSFGHYTCDNFGTKICARNWFGPNCSTFCKNTDDLTGHFNCDSLTGNKVCLTHWYGKGCLVFCKEQNSNGGHYSCNKTNGEIVCLQNWYGTTCTKYCLPQNDRLLGYFKCDVNGDKICLPGWHDVNCTQEILPTSVITCSTISHTNNDNETHVIPRNTDIQTLKRPSISSSTWNINQLKPTSTISPTNLHLTNKQATTLVASSSVKTSKQFSVNNEIHSFTNKERLKTSNYYDKTQTFNKVDLKTSPLNSSQTRSQRNESTRNTEPKTRAILPTRTLKTENPNKTPHADTDLTTQQKAQSSQALIPNSHGATQRKSQSKPVKENGMTAACVTETLTARNFTMPPKAHQSSATSHSNVSPQTSTLFDNRSITNPSRSFITEAIFFEKTKASSRTNNTTMTVKITSSGNLVAPMISTIMTSSSCTIERDGGKVLKKNYRSFVLVFFPTMAFMMAIGIGICIKIKQKKLIITKVAPVNDNLLSKANTSSQVFKISHSPNQQELLQMDVVSTK